MLTYWIAFIFGSCLASFINTMVWRYGLIHQHPAGMFSHCDACQSRLKFWQLIPIWGWILQKGRCFFVIASWILGCHYVKPSSAA